MTASNKDLEALVTSIIDKAESKLSAEDVKEARLYVDNREHEVAFVLICDQLYESGNRIPRESFELLNTAGRELKSERKSWQALSELVE